MLRTRINERLEARRRLVEENRQLVEGGGGEEGALTDEQAAEFDKRHAEIDRITAEVGRLEQQLADERALEAASNNRSGVGRGELDPAHGENRGGGASAGGDQAAFLAQYDGAFNAFLRHGPMWMDPDQRAILSRGRMVIREEQRDAAAGQTVATPTQGGHLVPQLMANSITEAMEFIGGVRLTRAMVMRTSSGAPMDFPTGDDTGNEGEMLGEEGTAVSTGLLTFGNVQLGSYTFSSKMVPVSNELLTDETVNLVDYIGRMLGERLGRVTNRLYTRGTGSSQPQGIRSAAANGYTATLAAAIALDDVKELIHSVDPSYRAQAEFMVHDDTVKAVSKIKDGEGRYMWEPSVKEGDPDRLLRYPYRLNQQMDTLAGGGAKSMLFGDMSYFTVREVMPMVLRRLEERYAENNQTAFIAFLRGDSVMREPGNYPVKALIHPSDD